jgi:hypothetical protein
MVKLTTAGRDKIAPKNFAGPNKSYPIENANHARNALSRVSQNGSPAVKAEVRAKVEQKYPAIKQTGPGKELERRLAAKDGPGVGKLGMAALGRKPK